MVMTTSQASASSWGVGAMSAPFSANALITPSFLPQLLKTIRRSFVSSAQQICTLKSATDTVFYICFEQAPSMYNAYYKKKKANMWQRVASWWYWRMRNDEIVLVMNCKMVTRFEKVRCHVCSHVAKPHKPHPLLPPTTLHHQVKKWASIGSDGVIKPPCSSNSVSKQVMILEYGRHRWWNKWA